MPRRTDRDCRAAAHRPAEEPDGGILDRGDVEDLDVDHDTWELLTDRVDRDIDELALPAFEHHEDVVPAGDVGALNRKDAIALDEPLKGVGALRGETTADDDGVGDDLAVAFPGELSEFTPTGSDEIAELQEAADLLHPRR